VGIELHGFLSLRDFAYFSEQERLVLSFYPTLGLFNDKTHFGTEEMNQIEFQEIRI
jgi:hypothetical protein